MYLIITRAAINNVLRIGIACLICAEYVCVLIWLNVYFLLMFSLVMSNFKQVGKCKLKRSVAVRVTLSVDADPGSS